MEIRMELFITIIEKVKIFHNFKYSRNTKMKKQKAEEK